MASNPSNLPPIPAGWVFETDPATGSTPAPAGLPPIPAGWALEVSPDSRVIDGDTFALADGRNARMSGVDAFEKNQTGVGMDGGAVPLGQRALSYLRSLISPASAVSATGDMTYGRPVVTVANDGTDAGGQVIGQGLGLPTPEYLGKDPARLAAYMDQQREAIAAERGAYAGQYQRPSDYRHQGDAAPMRGKIPMTTRQKVEYTKLLRSPDTTPEALDGWFAAQGHQVGNGANILDFMRRNPGAKASMYFQQEDALDAPVLPDGPNVVARGLGALNEGIADTLGAPVDLLNGGLGLLGLPVSDYPFGGSNSIRSGLHALGMGQDSEAYAPRSAAERYIQSIARGVGQAVIPAGGTIAAGARLGAAGAGMVSQEGGAVAQALRRMASEAAARPGLALAGELGGGVGAGIGGQAARDVAPGNPYADMVGQVLGGIGGGVAAGVAASARRAAPVARGGPATIEVESIGGQPAASDLPPIPAGFVLEDAPASVPTASPDVIPAAPATGPHGPIHADLSNDYPSAVARLMLDEDGEVPAVVQHPATGPIDLIWGEAGTGKSDGYGLAKIAKFHPEVLDDLPNIIATMDVRKVTPGRVQLESADHKAAVRLEYDGERKTWLLTAFRKEDAPASAMDSRADAGGQSFTDRGAPPDISATGAADNVSPPPPGFVLDSPARPPVQPTVQPDAVDDFILRSTKPNGKPGYGVEVTPEGDTAYVVFRDQTGRTKATTAVPLVPEARQNLGGIQTFVSPELRRQGVATRLYQTAREAGLPIDQLSGTGDLTPDGAAFVNAGRAMPSQIAPGPSLTGPATPSMGAVAGAGDIPPPPPGFVLDSDMPMPANSPAQMGADGLAALARTIDPRDMRPIPANTIGSLDEAMRANPGTLRDVQAPDERNALTPYRLRPTGPRRRDPLDLIGWLRTRGGIQDQGGNLRSAGIDNKARPIEFAKSEGFLGKLISDDGMTLDDAAAAAHDAGFFPDLPDRPTINEFLDAVADTHRGGSGRMFHPDDYAAIDEYRAAQDQRYAVERAEQDGAPIAEDVGQPVDMSDLDANQPPATAYEDLPSIAERAGNIDISKLESRGDIVRAVLGVHRKVGGFDAARRGVVSHAETEALASELNMTADDLLKRRQGQALNAEQALAARSILAKSADELVALAGKAEGGSDADLAAFRTAWIRHVAIQEQVSGITAEAGRTLSQFRMMAKSKLPVGRIHALQIEGAGGRDNLEEAARLILDAQGTPGGLNQSARLALKPGLKDKLVELYYNSLLSGPATHAVNITSNAMTAGLQLPEHLVAAGIGRLRTAFRTRTADADRVLMSEVGARATGLLQGAVDGLKAFAHTAVTGDVPDYVTKVEAASHEAISGLKGKILRTPTRMLSAEDELFKAIARKMELSGLAVRRARGEGHRGPALRARIAELNAKPTDEMVERSMDYARYLTFQKPLGKLGTLMTTATQHAPALKLIVPFVRTPTNILKFAAERSPAAPILKDWRADIAAGGARRDIAVARMAMGTGLGLLATKWADEGSITGGGPADKQARALMLADGWQPYSLRIGDTYYSYQRLDPLASTLGVAADLVETSEHMTETQRERSTMLVTAAIIKNLSNKVWLSGITNIAQAIDDPERYAGGFLAQMGGGIAVPAVVAQTARVTDPVMREARGPIDRVKSRIPGLSMTLPPKRDVWGEVITSEGGVGPDIVSPFRISTAQNDPVAAELLRLEAGIGAVPRKVGGRQLSPMEYSQYQEVAGKLLRQDLVTRIADAGWAGLNDEQRGKAVDDAKARTRKEARGLLFVAK